MQMNRRTMLVTTMLAVTVLTASGCSSSTTVLIVRNYNLPSDIGVQLSVSVSGITVPFVAGSVAPGKAATGKTKQSIDAGVVIPLAGNVLYQGKLYTLSGLGITLTTGATNEIRFGTDGTSLLVGVIVNGTQPNPNVVVATL